MNSGKRRNSHRAISSPEDFKLRAPTGSVTLWEGPSATKSALNHRLRKLVELGAGQGEGQGLNSERSGEFHRGQFSSPEDFKPQGSHRVCDPVGKDHSATSRP